MLSFPQKDKLVVYDLKKNKFVLDINSNETKGESINIGAQLVFIGLQSTSKLSDN